MKLGNNLFLDIVFLAISYFVFNTSINMIMSIIFIILFIDISYRNSFVFLEMTSNGMTKLFSVLNCLLILNRSLVRLVKLDR